MYRKCPKCGYVRQAYDTAPESQCPACGLIFIKWLKQRLRAPQMPVRKGRPRSATAPWLERIEAILLYVQSPVPRSDFYARLFLFVGLVIWGLWFIQTDHRQLLGGLPEINSSFMHRVDLVFHEAGHILFIPFGPFMAILGGSLGQLLIPAVVLGVFLFQQRDTFGASVGLWWLAQSFLDLAPYIHDARAGDPVLRHLSTICCAGSPLPIYSVRSFCGHQAFFLLSKINSGPRPFCWLAAFSAASINSDNSGAE